MIARCWMQRIALPAALAALAGAAGCQPAASPASAAKAPAPAKVVPAKEADLGTIKLTPEAEKRLALGLARVERKPVPRTCSYAGEVVVPFGRLVSVASPFTGTLMAPPGAEFSMPGSRVKQGQPIFILVPILSPEAKATMAPMLIEAQGQVKQAAESLHIAKVEFDRQENLMRDGLGNKGALVDAKARYDLAVATHKAAENRQEILAKVAADAESGSINRQTIAAPAAGTLQNVHAQPGQKVAAGALLFDVASLDTVWIKVPVYVGDLERIAPDKDAGIGSLAARPGAHTRPGKPIEAPPSGDPLAATVNLFYEVENKEGALRPGQRVGVTLPLKGAEQSLVVPRAALLRDFHGDTWVYEKTAPHTYVRRRVSVDRVVGNLTALETGPRPDSEVVTDGAAELFGSEFGGSK
jgi:RND family efflux transporter MFP subunit